MGRAWVRHRQQQRRLRRVPVFSKRSRNIIKVFKRFGMGGIAFLTPVLLSPIGGTVVATLLGVPRSELCSTCFGVPCCGAACLRWPAPASGTCYTIRVN